MPGSDKKKKEVTKNNRKKGCIYENLGNDEKRVPLGIEKYIFEPIWRSNIGNYLQEVRGYGSLAIKKQEKRYKKGLKKSASYSQSIVKI